MLAGKHGYEIVEKLIDTQKGKNGGEDDENPLGIGVPVNLHRIPSERPWEKNRWSVYVCCGKKSGIGMEEIFETWHG